MVTQANIQNAGLIGVGVIGGAYLGNMIPVPLSPLMKQAALAAAGVVLASMVDSAPLKMVALGIAGGAVAKAIGAHVVMAI